MYLRAKYNYPLNKRFGIYSQNYLKYTKIDQLNSTPLEICTKIL